MVSGEHPFTSITAGANYRIIMKNLERFESGEKKDEGGKTFVIRKVLLKNIKVHAKLSIAGVLKPTIPIVIDEIERTSARTASQCPR